MNKMSDERRDVAARLTVLLAKINRKKLAALPRAHRKKLFVGEEHYCPLCRSQLKEFLVFGVTSPRPGAWCPVCGSLERHRFAWLFLQRKTNLLDARPRTLLHIAPEPMLESNFRQVANLDYMSADLENPRAMVRMDITDIHYPENSFDAIFCSHVLEHVTDDRRAMREFYRVLKPGGWALLMVPIASNRTFEDSSVTSPEERQRLFGQHNHLRKYGPDFKDRVEEARFGVKVFYASELAGTDDLFRLGLSKARREENLFFCEKAPKSELSGAQGVSDQQSPQQAQDSKYRIEELKNHLVEERQKAQQLRYRNQRQSAQVKRLKKQLQEIRGSNTWKLLRYINHMRNEARSKVTILARKVKDSTKKQP